MKIKDLLKSDADVVYGATEKLFALFDDAQLDWKPESGKNWMTAGQCILHCTNACGHIAQMFVSGDWGMPEEGYDESEMLPGAQTMPSANSISEALSKLAKDKESFIAAIDSTKEEDLLNKLSTAPWGGPERPLAGHMNSCIAHLETHKAQLFYYLKLQGKEVNTMQLWGV